MGILEDDACDILRKARSGLGLSREALSRAAGVPRSCLVRMESGGDGSDDEWRAVASVLGLAPAPLVEIARGRWCPGPPDGGLLSHVVTVPSYLRGYQVRCYLLGCRTGGSAILFDCGVDAEAVLSALRDREWTLSSILVTHGHGDHIGALDGIVRHARPDEVVLPSQGARGGAWRCGPFRVERAPTPGHTADSVSYVVFGEPGAPWACVVGDLLFAGSVGGAGHDHAVLLRSVRDVVLALPDDVAILPGHGPTTTVGEERRHNPFLAPDGGTRTAARDTRG